MNRCGDAIRVFSASAHIPAAVDDALALQRRLWRLNEAFARYNLAACVKAGLAIQGYEVGDPIPPQAALTAEERKAVEAVLRDLG